MNNILQPDSENIESILQKVASQGTDYLKNINDRPTSSKFDSQENWQVFMTKIHKLQIKTEIFLQILNYKLSIYY